MTPTKKPPERESTVREELRRALLRGPATANDLSREVGIREREIPDHLEHLAKSAENRGERFVTYPASCIACGFTFENREKLKKPGACPKCRSTRIDPPMYQLKTP